jgi:hypothetical protein
MKKQILGPYIIGSAIIWGLVLIGASLRMGGFENKSEVLSILGLGAGIHLILIWGPLAAALKKLTTEGDDSS